jgi:K+-transporting ATPase KdpF subunit
MGIEMWLGLVVAVVLIGYLTYALLQAEKF